MTQEKTYYCDTVGCEEKYLVLAACPYDAAKQFAGDLSTDDRSYTWTVGVHFNGELCASHDITIHPSLPAGVDGDTVWRQKSVVGSRHGGVIVVDIAYCGILRVTDTGANRSYDGSRVTTITYMDSELSEEAQAVVDSDSLEELAETLNRAENSICGPDGACKSLMDIGIDVTGLRVFGGPAPVDTAEIYSWDDHGILISVNGNWCVKDR